MKKIIKLTESDLTRIVKRVISESKDKDHNKIEKLICSAMDRFVGEDDYTCGYKESSDKPYDRFMVKIKNVIDEDTEELIGKPHSYVIVADTAKGVGGDYSAFVIVDITDIPYKLVGKFRDNKIAPMLYPTVIHKIAKDYNNAYVLIEVNSSEQVAHIMHNELEYDNIIFVNRDTKKGQVVSGGFGGGKTQLGVQTDKRVKRIGCFTFKALVEEKIGDSINYLLLLEASIEDKRNKSLPF
jgi:hypothetical protein